MLANFSAAWCGPCRIIAPFYVELSEKHPSIMFLTVDVDELTVSFSASVQPEMTKSDSLNNSYIFSLSCKNLYIRLSSVSEEDT